METVRWVMSAIKSFLKGLVTATQNYLRGKTRHLPKVLPKGRREMIDAILERPHHQDFLHSFAQECGMSIDHVERTFRNNLHEIGADQNYLVYPFWDFILTWIFETIYEGIEVNKEALEKLRTLTKYPIVFVPSHRSHIDYLVLHYVLYCNALPMPQICAGANLSFWPLGPVFRKAGAFFIRRSYEGNKLYAAAAQAYIEEVIRQKMPLEFFIEGTRSRTGKLLPPRMGILSAVARAYRKGAAEDVLIVPASFTYESVLEDKSYLDEQAGAAKKDESFWDLFYLRKYLRKRKGKVYLQFGEPISLKDSLSGSDGFAQIERLAYDITYGINKSTVVTPASLTATALLTQPSRSISEKSVQETVHNYLHYLAFKQCRFSEPLAKYENLAIKESLKHYVKSHLVQEFFDMDEALFRVVEEKRPLLDYYKNSSLHFFVSIAVLSTILLKQFRGKPGDAQVPLKEVEEDYSFFQDLFRYEFTFSRRESLSNHLEKLIEYLVEKEALTISKGRVCLTPRASPLLFHFSSLIRNYLETYFVLWKSIPLLEQRRWESKDLIKFLLDRGNALYLRESIDRPEAINRFTLQSAISSFRSLGIFSEEIEGWGKKKRIYYKVMNQGDLVGKTLSEMLDAAASRNGS